MNLKYLNKMGYRDRPENFIVTFAPVYFGAAFGFEVVELILFIVADFVLYPSTRFDFPHDIHIKNSFYSK